MQTSLRMWQSKTAYALRYNRNDHVQCTFLQQLWISGLKTTNQIFFKQRSKMATCRQVNSEERESQYCYEITELCDIKSVIKKMTSSQQRQPLQRIVLPWRQGGSTQRYCREKTTGQLQSALSARS